eukprot:TRINITY_DN1534_c0_g3_i4.p1 TRINITY_DN1534_c0_g3~~TRINITY_DN1534_c0_g3_i4.p1  ORF type:complete len:572 (+),score=161.19 TRINITY_DN1534_c0_g3_i4:143-1858(+)
MKFKIEFNNDVRRIDTANCPDFAALLETLVKLYGNNPYLIQVQSASGSKLSVSNNDQFHAALNHASSSNQIPKFFVSFVPVGRARSDSDDGWEVIGKEEDEKAPAQQPGAEVSEVVPVAQQDAPAVAPQDAPAVVQQDAPAVVQQDAPAVVQQDAPLVVQQDAPAAAQQDAPAVVQQDAPAAAEQNVAVIPDVAAPHVVHPHVAEHPYTAPLESKKAYASSVFTGPSVITTSDPTSSYASSGPLPKSKKCPHSFVESRATATHYAGPAAGPSLIAADLTASVDDVKYGSPATFSFCIANEPAEEKIEAEEAEEAESRNVESHGVQCSSCHKQIRGIRWQCAVCPSFSLCSICDQEDRHDPLHAFLRLKHPRQSFAPAPAAPAPAPIAPAPAPAAPAPAPVPAPVPVAPVPAPRPVVSRRLSSSFIRSNGIPENAQVAPNEEFLVSWVIRNDGDVDWDNAILRHVEGSFADQALVAIPRTSSGRDVEVTFMLKAPLNPGPYRGVWRVCVGEQFVGQPVTVSIFVRAPAPLDPLEEKLEALKALGFVDRDRNLQLLNQFKNNMDRVVDALLRS